MNNTTNTCRISASYLAATSAANYVTYFVITPIYFFLGFGGHVACLLAYRRLAKKEKAYVYQVAACIGETLEIISFTIFSFTTRWWGGAVGAAGVYWFASNYALMWYTCRLAIPGVNSLITSSLLLNVVMAADRALALSKPIVYKNLTGNFRHYASIAACFVVATTTSAFDVFRFEIVWSTDRYVRNLNAAYVASDTAKVLANLQTAVRITGLALLVFFNVIIIKYFRISFLKVAVNVHGDAKMAKRKEGEKTLIVLTVVNSTLETFSMLPLALYFLLTYVLPNFGACYTLMAPINDGILQLAQVANFYILFGISKPFRTMVLNALRRRTTPDADGTKAGQGNVAR